VLDACRNNPFTEKATGKGLAQMDAPPSTLLAYATAPGNVAEDGKGSNGLYTSALLPELRKPEQKIEDIFKRTRFSVRRQSLGRQIPWESTSLEDDFYFLPPKVTAKATEEQVKREVEVELAAWSRVKDSREPDAFIEYLRTFPSGRFGEMAQFRLDQLAKPVVVAAAGKGQVQALASGTQRYRLGDWIQGDFVNHTTGGREKFEVTVTRADDMVAEFNNGTTMWSQMGAVLDTPQQNFGNGLLLIPADIGLGKRWRTAFKSTGKTWRGTEDSYYEFKVTGREPVVTPSGTFDCFKVEGEGWASGEGEGKFWGVKLWQQYWVDPVRMWRVKGESKIWPSGQRMRHNSFVHTAFRRGPG
jgi:hypothetical protein